MSEEVRYQLVTQQDDDGKWHASLVPAPPAPPDNTLRLKSVFDGNIIALLVPEDEGVGNMASYVYGPLVYLGDSSYNMGGFALTYEQARQLADWLLAHVPAEEKE